MDVDLNKVPKHLLEEEDPIFAFNKQIVDATAAYCVAYKPNLAFYEAYGVKGLMSFEKTVKYIQENYPEQFIIADAKRGDIGNTSKMYAQTFFGEYKVDALTFDKYLLSAYYVTDTHKTTKNSDILMGKIRLPCSCFFFQF